MLGVVDLRRFCGICEAPPFDNGKFNPEQNLKAEKALNGDLVELSLDLINSVRDYRAVFARFMTMR